MKNHAAKMHKTIIGHTIILSNNGFKFVTVFVAIIVPVDNKKNAFWGPLFEPKIMGIFSIFIMDFAYFYPSR